MERLAFTVSYFRGGSMLRKFEVPVSRQVLHGVYFNGIPYLPDIDAVKAAMPKTLHKAIDRGLGFWTDKYSDVVTMDLHGYSKPYWKQGKPLGTILAQANWKATPCRLEGYSRGRLNACAIQISDNLYQVASDCGKVSIRVRASIVENRLSDAAQGGYIPTFYYE